ncbi:hypothetical protein QR680_002848 [Steinernema hermaphroditum]|uniref:Uncharacterized protein n=1 Tax=Steinernema hermaphroditum TaxID=289476 RepID=A0AA39LIX2_9BILA|nr:hypothetical protein QR680_002848 [Steinernema hermaphroditum]
MRAVVLLALVSSVLAQYQTGYARAGGSYQSAPVRSYPVQPQQQGYAVAPPSLTGLSNIQHFDRVAMANNRAEDMPSLNPNNPTNSPIFNLILSPRMAKVATADNSLEDTPLAVRVDTSRAVAKGMDKAAIKQEAMLKEDNNPDMVSLAVVTDSKPVEATVRLADTDKVNRVEDMPTATRQVVAMAKDNKLVAAMDKDSRLADPTGKDRRLVDPTDKDSRPVDPTDKDSRLVDPTDKDSRLVDMPMVVLEVDMDKDNKLVHTAEVDTHSLALGSGYATAPPQIVQPAPQPIPAPHPAPQTYQPRPQPVPQPAPEPIPEIPEPAPLPAPQPYRPAPPTVIVEPLPSPTPAPYQPRPAPQPAPQTYEPAPAPVPAPSPAPAPYHPAPAPQPTPGPVYRPAPPVYKPEPAPHPASKGGYDVPLAPHVAKPVHYENVVSEHY